MRQKVCEHDGCKRPMLMVPLAGVGAVVIIEPVDPTPVWPALVGHVGVNPETGKGMVVRLADVESGRATSWRERGVIFYVSHFATCPGASAVRNRPRPGQETMFDA